MAQESDEQRTAAPQPHEPGFIRRVLIAYAIGGLFLLLAALLWYASNVLLLIFSGILAATLLHDASCVLRTRFRLSRGLALGLVLLAAILLIALAGWFLAPQVSEQIRQLSADLPGAVQRLRDYLERYPAMQQLVDRMPAQEQVFKDAPAIAARAGSVFSGVLGGLGNFVIILFLAIYLAVQPGAYAEGVVKLVPKERRPRARQVLNELGKTLRYWLRGKLLSMVLVGVATATGLALLGVPLALGLGILAGLLDFIPYIGPILAGIPAVLMAFTQSPTLALYVVLLYMALQSVESYLLLPLIDRRTVSLPPALNIALQVLMALPFGLVGVALATPLAAVIAVLVAMLYVEDVLKDQVTLPSDQQ